VPHEEDAEALASGDFQNLQREKDGTLDKLMHLYRSPDIKTIVALRNTATSVVENRTSSSASHCLSVNFQRVMR